MADHERLAQRLAIRIFFADPHSLWPSMISRCLPQIDTAFFILTSSLFGLHFPCLLTM